MDEWEDYNKDLFRDEQKLLPNLSWNREPQVEKAVIQSKKNKASEPDQTCRECLKLLSNDNIKELTVFISQIYDTSKIPSIWLKSVFILLLKKRNSKKM